MNAEAASVSRSVSRGEPVVFLASCLISSQAVGGSALIATRPW